MFVLLLYAALGYLLVRIVVVLQEQRAESPTRLRGDGDTVRTMVGVRVAVSQLVVSRRALTRVSLLD